MAEVQDFTVASLLNRIRELENGYAVRSDEVTGFIAMERDLRARIRELEATLRWYANPQRHDGSDVGPTHPNYSAVPFNAVGMRARAALAPKEPK